MKKMKSLILALILALFSAWVPVHAEIYTQIPTTGGSAFASSQWNSSYNEKYAFDGSLQTYWSSARGYATYQSVGYKFTAPQRVTKFGYVSSFSSYGPADFIFQASNDGTSWTNLFSGRGQNITSWQYFTFQNSTAYTQYRLYILNAYNSTNIDIQEIAFYSSPDGISTINQASVAITPGRLSVDLPGSSTSFTGIALNGSSQITQADFGGPIFVTDSTGFGEGWHLSVNATQMTEQLPTGGFAPGTTAKTLPRGSLTLESPSSIAANGTTSPAPAISTGAPWVIDNSSSVTIASAAMNAGMGIFNISFPYNPLKLTVNPGTTYVDTVNYPNQPTLYSTTITFTVSVGP